MRGRLIALFITATFFYGCASPTQPSGAAIVGDWSGLHFGNACCIYWNIRIVSENGQLTGKACLTSSGRLVWDNIPVTVASPHHQYQISFVDPGGQTWSGPFEGDALYLAPEGHNAGSRYLDRGGDYCASVR